ncbi:MAG: hypothetical protein JWO36_4792 [Myxococcales bacterium]|nr:hypothetical protein [Myxococcales bacterium]
MRNPKVGRLFAVLFASLALVACGPSSKEMAGAKSARYKGDKLQLFALAKAATEAKYKLQKSDEVALGFQTEGRWYTPEGLAASERSGDMRDVPDRSVNEVLVVQLVPDGDAYVVTVKPVMLRYFAGRPNPDQLTEDDPSVPGWAHGKVDNLAVDIHEALKQFEVKTVPAMLPAPTSGAPGATPPAPAPASPAPAPAPAQ